MQELERKSRDRPIELVSLKGQGKKIIEYYGDYIPEQWIKAAGAEGYLICKGGDPQAPEATLDYSLRFMNPLAASMVGNYLVGVDRVMPMADCVAIQQHDCHYGRMSEILEVKGLPVYKVGVPADFKVDISREYYRHELRECRAHLEKLVGHPLDEAAVIAYVLLAIALLLWLVWILLTTIVNGFQALNLRLFTEMTPPPGSEGGLANAFYGSFLMSGIGLLIGTPIGLMAGIWLWLGYVVAGILACLLIITIPVGVASFRMASYALWPFGRTIVDNPHAGAPSVLGNVVWVLLFGWWLALGHLVTAVAQAVTIVGIPLAIANLKIIPVSFAPLGKDIVPVGPLAANAPHVYDFTI